MDPVKRHASSLLLASGIAVVFAGLSAALGFTAGGMIASVAAIASLLYAGGLWFGSAPATLAVAGADTVIVFDRSLRITAGGAPGASLLLRFPEPLRPEIEMRCHLALRGEHTHFDCEHGGARLSFDIAPIQSVSGTVLYGVLIAGSGVPMRAVSAAPLTTVA